MNSYGIKHHTSSPNYPQSNGFSERMVQTVKHVLSKSSDPYMAMLCLRATPVAHNLPSPCELLNKRRYQTNLPAAGTRSDGETCEKLQDRQQQQKQRYDQHTRELPWELPQLKARRRDQVNLRLLRCLLCAVHCQGSCWHDWRVFTRIHAQRKDLKGLDAGFPVAKACPNPAQTVRQSRFFRSSQMPTDRPQPHFVLVRPQMGENIGGAARAMWNFGLDRMRIVAPRDGWPNQKAVAMASGAGRLLDEAQLAQDLPEALADCTYVFATTARPRELTKPVFSPEGAMKKAAELLRQGEKVAVLFGPERAGLENDDIAKANAIITVPVNPEFASLNLAQCVLLTAYEWRRQEEQVPDETFEIGKSDWATGQEIEALVTHYEERLTEAGYFFPPEKAPGMKTVFRNLWSRMRLTRADVQMLHGVMRQMVRWKQHGSD